MNRKGQVTIFIILAILIVVGILLFMFLSKSDPEVIPPTDLGPRASVISCVKDIVDDSIAKIMEGGGEILPSQAIMYDGGEWNYLCYQADYYQGCYNIHPMLELQIEKEIEADTSVAVQTCFNLMKGEFEGRGFGVTLEPGKEYSIDLLPGFVRINLDKGVEILEGERAQSFDDFGLETQSPIYDLVRVSREIVNSESQFCYFEYNGYMLLYPEYDIRRIDYRDSKIYRVIDRWTGAEFKFAVRSCAFSPGL
jgi:hypothetical protein